MDANFFLPEVLQFYLDDSQCNGIIEVSGDVSHFNRIDNPIIELFRTVEQDVREKNGHKLSFVAGCPTYNPAKNITSCHFYPNMAGLHWRQERIRVKVQEILVDQIVPMFEDLLACYFDSDKFRDYQLNLADLMSGTAGDDKDKIDQLVSNCNSSIKDFITRSGYALPVRRRVQIMPKNNQSQEIPNPLELY